MATTTIKWDATNLTRGQFISRARSNLARFCFPDDGVPAMTVNVGPYVCDCGHTERDAGKIWDHAQTAHNA